MLCFFAELLARCRGYRGTALPSGLVVVSLLLPASAVQAQRLLTLLEGVGAPSSAGDLGPSIGPVPVAVDVDLALLRSAPWRLEAPTPDGSVLVAERGVFEDRGGGDLMWSGGQPGAGYDTVVLTVEGGRFVGRFGGYRIHAGRDGRGGMAPIVGERPDNWCGVDSAEEGDHAGHAHPAAGVNANATGAEGAATGAGADRAESPQPVSNPQSHDRLDILVAYTETAARNWARIGGPHAAIRHAGDYMKMVFRNNGLGVEPHIVHIARASAALDRAGRDRGRLAEHPLGSSSVLDDGEILRLRHEHRADFVHLFTGEPPHLVKTCGVHTALLSGNTAASYFEKAYGFTSNHAICGDYAATFVHEVGHGLGANHEPAYAFSPERRIRPYATGHVNHDAVPTIGTAMTYGGQTEPFFSTSRFDLYGAALGVADERDNERTLRETVHMGARYSDYLPRLEELPAQPGDLRVRYADGAAHLSWRDNAPAADGYELVLGSPVPVGGELRCCFERTLKLQGRDRASIPLEYTTPGAPYRFWIRARKGKVRSLRGSIVRLRVPDDLSGSPAAPSDLSVAVAPDGKNVDFRWADNSDDEAGFDLQMLVNGEVAERYLLPPDSEHYERGYFDIIFGGGGVSGRLLPQGGLDYGARVYAFDASGQASSSEEVSFRWEHPDGRPLVADVAAFATGPTTARVTWTDDPGVDKYQVEAKVDGMSLHRVWRRSANGPGTEGWIDLEGLARGGNYTFSVRVGPNLSTRAYLTLGARGPGPRAPSELSWERDGDDHIRLGWSDNSTDELGFVVQSGYDPAKFKLTTEILPEDTESVRQWFSVPRLYRVFAYNEHGYSLSSQPVYVPPAGAAGTCRPDAENLCLRNSRFSVEGGAREKQGGQYVGQYRLRVVNEGTDDSGLFYIFSPDNWEFLVKVLDGCEENGHMWVLVASTTDLEYYVRFTDTATNESRVYLNEAGQPAPAIVDSEAFSEACDFGAAGR